VNLPAKRLVPACVVPAVTTATEVTPVPGDVKMTTTSLSATLADSVASTAVAAVLASHTYMKVSGLLAFVCFHVSQHCGSFIYSMLKAYSKCMEKHVQTRNLGQSPT